MQKNHNNSKSTCHTRFSHSVLQLAYRLAYMCRFATLCEHFFPVQIDVFSVFCQKEFRKQPKFHILFILTGKIASKWLEWHIFRVQGMPNPMPQVSSLCDKQFLKNHNFRQKFHILFILTGKNALKLFEWHIFRVWGLPNPMPQVLHLCNKQFLKNHNFRQKFHILLILTGKNAMKLLEWHIFRVQGMPNPMALLASLYNMWFMKIHNCWWHIAENGVQNIWKWDGTYAAVLLGAHFTPTPCYRTLYLDLPIKMQKTHNNTKSSHIVHYDRHSQKPIVHRFASLCKHFLPG